MSKAAKQSLIILGILLIASLGFAGYTLFEKTNLEKDKQSLQSQLMKTKDSEKKSQNQVKQLTGEVTELNSQKSRIERELQAAERKAQELLAQVSSIESERDKFKGRIDDLLRSSDELKNKTRQLEKTVADKNAMIEELKEQMAAKKPAAQPASAPAMADNSSQKSMPTPTMASSSGRPMASGYESPSIVDEDYWASLLRDKAALEVEITNLKSDLSKSSMEVVEYKQQNADLKVELDSLTAFRNEIEREIKYKTDLINNLSLELARTKNDKKFIADQVGKLTEDNRDLRNQVKQLVSTKGALEKSIVRLSQDKDKVTKKLVETENVIQSKIDEIWDVKESLDRTFDNMKLDPSSITPDIELPPIVVNAYGSSPAVQFDSGMSAPGFNGTVVSVNEENQFVIVNIGEGQGVKLGETLSIYRDSKYIARVEVIQVRKDISAADIKDQWSKIQPGDNVH